MGRYGDREMNAQKEGERIVNYLERRRGAAQNPEASLDSLAKKPAATDIRDHQDICNSALVRSAIAEQEERERLFMEAIVHYQKILEFVCFALEPYNDIKPRDWKTDRENLRDAYQRACGAIGKTNKAPTRCDND